MVFLGEKDFFYQNTVNNLSFTLGSVINIQSREKVGKKRVVKKIFPKLEDNYQIYTSKSLNGWITNRTFFMNGQRCDVFGRTISDIGYEGIKEKLSYPLPSDEFNLRHNKSKKYDKVGGLDSDINLNIKKSNNNYFHTLEKLKKINKLKLLNSNNESTDMISENINQNLSEYLINHFNSFQNKGYVKKGNIIYNIPVLNNNTIPYNFISPPPKFKIDNILPKKLNNIS